MRNAFHIILVIERPLASGMASTSLPSVKYERRLETYVRCLSTESPVLCIRVATETVTHGPAGDDLQSASWGPGR